ncbi:uncharacterized protein [Haliotis asinina]|uniref:uncharacterized protein isoform X1 n=1 Tax=Haliotis asinina TaxID=109174 RepID=UPI0035321221
MDQENGASGTSDGESHGATSEPSHTAQQHEGQGLWSSRSDWLEQEVRSLRRIVEDLQKHPQLTPRGSKKSRDIVTELERRVSELEQNRSAQHEKRAQAQPRQRPGGKTVFPYLLSRDTAAFRSASSSSSDASDNDGGVREIYLSGSSRPVLCPLLDLNEQEHRNRKGEHKSLLRHKMSLDKPKKMCATSDIPYTDSPQYWEVQAAVKLLDVLKPGHTIFEITLSQRTKEAHKTLNQQEAVRLSLSYCKDHERVCVMTTTGRDVYVKHDTDLIKNIKDVHTWIRFEIGVLVDRKRKSAVFLNLRQNASFAVVKDIGFHEDLWSVFGIVIYTTGNRFLVNMTLVSGSDIEITGRKKKLIEKVVEK